MAAARLRLPPTFKSLSARLLVMTVAFVMLAEVLIYAPSVARYRLTYLRDTISNAHLATLALDATPDHLLSAELTERLLDHARAHAVIQHLDDQPRRMLTDGTPPRVNDTVDLREQTFLSLVVSAFGTMFQGENRVLRVLGRSPKNPDVLMEVIIDEAPLRAQMIDYSWRILLLSLLISFVTAGLVFLAIRWLTVRPLRNLTRNMVDFSNDPENQDLLMRPGDRTDEVGVAERELRNLQIGLRGALYQKQRLAALGTAVTKINHDLRGMLSTVQLMSDRLADSQDPQVQKALPTLLRSVDHAVHLCTQTLDYARNDGARIHCQEFLLADLVDEVYAACENAGRTKPTLVNRIAGDLSVYADRAQVYRLVNNLVRNALQAGSSAVIVEAGRNSDLSIDVKDNGPGLPESAMDGLFQAFNSSKNSGTGLGLAIAREVANVHGGDITLVNTSDKGCHFRVVLPDA